MVRVRRKPLAIACIVLMLMVAGLRLLRRDKQMVRNSRPENSTVITPERTPRRTLPSRNDGGSERIRRPVEGRTRETITTKTGEVPLTGYVLDDFRNWTSLPKGYSADGLLVSQGAVTLMPSADKGSPRVGSLISPALVLKQPSMPIYTQPRRELPAGTGVQVEIAVSRDGKTWSGYSLLERYSKPDGRNELSAATAASMADIASTATVASGEGGPTIRYRMTLTSDNEQAPIIRDLRIWHIGS